MTKKTVSKVTVSSEVKDVLDLFPVPVAPVEAWLEAKEVMERTIEEADEAFQAEYAQYKAKVWKYMMLNWTPK